MLERPLPHGSVKTVQYQERKYAYGLEESGSPLQGLVQPLVCSDHHTELDNATNLLLLPIGRPEGAPPGLSLLNPLRWILSHLLSSWDSLELPQQDQNQAP